MTRLVTEGHTHASALNNETSGAKGEDDLEGSVREKKAEGSTGSCQVMRPSRELGEQWLTQTHPFLP